MHRLRPLTGGYVYVSTQNYEKPHKLDYAITPLCMSFHSWITSKSHVHVHPPQRRLIFMVELIINSITDSSTDVQSHSVASGHFHTPLQSHVSTAPKNWAWWVRGHVLVFWWPLQNCCPRLRLAGVSLCLFPHSLTNQLFKFCKWFNKNNTWLFYSHF